MDAVKGVLREELEYELKVRERYEEALFALPKGSLSKKRIGGRDYFYLAHREGPTIKTVYVGKADAEEVQAYQANIAKRKRYQRMLRETKRTIRYLKKVLNVKSA